MRLAGRTVKRNAPTAEEGSLRACNPNKTLVVVQFEIHSPFANFVGN